MRRVTEFSPSVAHRVGAFSDSRDNIAARDSSEPHLTYISQLERRLKWPTLRVCRGLAEALGTSGAELLLMVDEATHVANRGG